MHITKEDLKLIANTIRTLSMDAVQKANSGHPGMPMGCADIAAILAAKIINHYPPDPGWKNRDRFVLSPGHGSMLLYSMLHLSGYDISMEDIKNFRQLRSKTPGHPEYGHTQGVETTTGPLGQGFANAVGMAVASKLMAKEFNDDSAIIDHYVYAIVSDGDLMEGISSEAGSLAGHMGLGNIIFIYDSNDITIEGSTELAFSEDVEKRFLSYNWHVQNINGHDFDEIEKAVDHAQKEKDKPSLIIAKTRIAKGSPNKEGSEESHGSPLGEEEIKKTKTCIGCCETDKFCVSERVYDIFRQRKEELGVLYAEWTERFNKTITGDKKAGWERFFQSPDLSAIRQSLPVFDEKKAVATRSASGKILESLFKQLPNIVGGSADLAPSNKSFVKGFSESGKNKVGRNIHFGIREHAMGAIQNGIAYYGGFIPYSATFFVFMDYMRPPVRIAAMSGLKCVYVFTHDSIFVGEDGPTHQPVEHIASARAIPNLTVIRPADAEETKEAWIAALERSHGPTAILLTRQDVPIVTGKLSSGLHKGAYIVRDTENPDIILIATGSEVHISIKAALELQDKGIKARVVSFPSWELFEKQDDAYKKKILPDNMKKRAVIEAGISMGWERYAGNDALYITMNGFGTSAPADVLAGMFGFTSENIVKKVTEYLKSK